MSYSLVVSFLLFFLPEAFLQSHFQMHWEHGTFKKHERKDDYCSGPAASPASAFMLSLRRRCRRNVVVINELESRASIETPCRGLLFVDDSIEHISYANNLTL
ncbi:hypothetical protein Peur_058410 [Populus x canadensis]